MTTVVTFTKRCLRWKQEGEILSSNYWQKSALCVGGTVFIKKHDMMEAII